MSKKVLITGGLGYIGSHTAVALNKEGFEVIILDDLSNSSISVLDGIEKIIEKKPFFKKIDLKDRNAMNAFFKKNPDINNIIHFAAHKFVGESVKKPLQYYQNNITGLLNLLEIFKNKPTRFIFSSSCTVYGESEFFPIKEHAPIKKANCPYGNTKKIGEEILLDTTVADKNLEVISLRYFNPIGAHPSTQIGELPKGKPQNLVPFITQTAAGAHKNLTIFGNDYNTKDGTCIRDYIYIMDLAKAHVEALKYLIGKKNTTSFEVFNIGTGIGKTVLEVISSFEKMSEKKLNYSFGKRRQGDVEAAYADTSKADKILKWKAQTSLDDAILSAWKWEQKIRNLT